MLFPTGRTKPGRDGKLYTLLLPGWGTRFKPSLPAKTNGDHNNSLATTSAPSLLSLDIGPPPRREVTIKRGVPSFVAPDHIETRTC